MSKQDDIIEHLIVGGFVGAALSALISKRKEGSLLGGLAGAVLFASFKASERAREANIPLVLEEDDTLYELMPNGEKKLLRHLPKNKTEVPSRFKLK